MQGNVLTVLWNFQNENFDIYVLTGLIGSIAQVSLILQVYITSI